MTNQEAISIIDTVAAGMEHRYMYSDEEISEAFDMAVETLEQPEPWNEMLVMCDNCGHAIHVKREDVKKPEPCEDSDELDEAIRLFERREKADDPKHFGVPKTMAEYGRYCRQLAEWLKELKQLRVEKDFRDPPDLESYKKGYVDGFNEGAKTRESCEDAVSRDEATYILTELIESCENGTPCYAKARVEMAALSSVTPKQKTGEWLTTDDMYETGFCSCCKWDSQEPVSYVVTNFEYCPNCGAKMS